MTSTIESSKNPFMCYCKVLALTDGKTFQRESNAGVNCFLSPVKCVLSFMLFCCKSELCCDLRFWGEFFLLFFYLLLYCCLIRCMAGFFFSYLLSNTCYAVLSLIHFYHNLRTLSGKIVCWGKKLSFFHVSCSCTRTRKYTLILKKNCSAVSWCKELPICRS